LGCSPCGSGGVGEDRRLLPCPRSSKHWGIATVMFAVRQRRRWANSATPKPCPRSSKHWGIATAVRQRRRGQTRRAHSGGAEAWANSATPKPCPRSSKHWGIATVMFAVRQRRRWANSATPKPCPRSSKHWGIATVMFAVRQRRRWAQSATPKPCPRSSKHWGIAIEMFAVRQRRRWAHLGDPQAVPPLIQALGDSDVPPLMFACSSVEALGKLGDPQAVPALIQALGDSDVMFAVRQRRRWAQSATPKPCPRSSWGKHWGIACPRSLGDVRACGSVGVGRNSATPKPCPRSSKHWGIATGLFAVRQRRRWADRRPPSRARAHPSTGG
jgi:hypothetical protein